MATSLESEGPLMQWNGAVEILRPYNAAWYVLGCLRFFVGGHQAPKRAKQRGGRQEAEAEQRGRYQRKVPGVR